MHLLYRSNNFWKAPWKSSCVSVSQPLSSPQLSQRQPLRLGNNTVSKVWTIERVRNCLDAHLGQMICDKDGLVHCPGANANNPIWRLLASSDGISSHTSHHPSQTPCLPSLNLLCHSKTDARFMQEAPKTVWSVPYVFVAVFSKFKTQFYCISFF